MSIPNWVAVFRIKKLLLLINRKKPKSAREKWKKKGKNRKIDQMEREKKVPNFPVGKLEWCHVISIRVSKVTRI